MSCHDIGYGMASVAKAVLEEYDDGRIGYESAFRLLMACKNGVHWCDGNEWEATRPFEDRCGICLRKDVELHDADYGKSDRKKIIHPYLCDDCMKTEGVVPYDGQ